MKRNLKEDDDGRMEYLKALEDALEAENYLCTWGDEPLGKLIVDTDLGMFDIDYVPGEWVYVVHFSGPNREFTKYRKYTDDVVEIVVNVVEDQLDDWSTEHYMESNRKNKKESTLDLFGQNAKVHKDKNWKPVPTKKQIKERRMPYSEIPQVEDYVGTARAKGFECIEGSLVSKTKEVFTPVIMKINGNVEARLRIFSQGNYTIFTDKGGWEGLDLEEFEKDLDDLRSLYESVSKKSNRIKEAADKKVPGMKWWRDGDVYEPNFFSSRRGPGVDAKAVDEELDSIIEKYDNCFPVKDDLTFEIEYWDTFNGDNVSVTFVFNRDFEGDEFKEVKDLLDNKLLKEFGFGDSDVHGTGWNSKRHANEWLLCWYKYSDYNKDHTFKRPNPLDSNTKGGQINGTEPFTLEEGKEISKVVMEYIVELFKANPAGVYYRPSKAIKTVEIPEHRLRPFTPSWKGSYTHNTGWLGFSCYIEDAYDENATDWRGQKGDYYRADEGIITALLRNKAAETLNDFLYEFNLEVVPEDCEAHWYHGSEEDEANGVLFEVNIEFKEIGVDSIESYYSHKGNSFKSYFDWDEEGVKDLYKGKTFKRNPKRVKESKNLKERVLDYDTWDKYYDEGSEAYFEGKTLSDVPITGNAWFREAWEEGWKNAKAYDDEDARRAEAEYEEELEWEEAAEEDK